MASDAEQASLLGQVRDKLEEDLSKIAEIERLIDDVRRIGMSVKDDMNETKTTMIMVSEGNLITQAIAIIGEGEEKVEIVEDESAEIVDACNDTKGFISSAIPLIEAKIQSLLQ